MIDFKKASELINNGYLIHGTPETFNKFDRKFIKGGSRAKEGYGFYFTDNIYKAFDYGNNIKAIRKSDFNFLDFNQPIDINIFFDEKLYDEIKELNEKLMNTRNSKVYAEIENMLKVKKNKLKNYDKNLYESVKSAINSGASDYGSLWSLIEFPKYNHPLIIETLINNGYDGFHSDNIYTVFNIEKLNSLKINMTENKDIIHRILKEELNRHMLNESLTDVVYHFTSFGAIYNIITNDSYYLQSSFSSYSDDFGDKRKFYISTTRQKSGKVGYSKTKNVRITLNGQALNQRYKGKAVDYWGPEQGLHSYYTNPEAHGSSKIDYTQSTTENEDRLFSNEPVIYDFHKYVERIDILFENEREKEISEKILHRAYRTHFRDMIFLYDDKEEFDIQSKNTVNSQFEIYGDSEFDNRNSFNPQLFESNLADIMFFMLTFDRENITSKNRDKYVSLWLKKYGLEKYIRKVLSRISYKTPYIDEMSIRNPIKTIHDDVNDKELYSKTALMVRDYFRKNKFKNENEAKSLYKSNYYNNYKYDNIDYDKEIVFNVFKDGSGRRYIILNPEKDSFWKLIPDSKDLFLNSLPYNINSHKSKDDEHFRKYLKHLTMNDISISKMLDIINKLDIDEDFKNELLDYGKFYKEKVEYFHLDRYYFMSKSDKKEAENMFKKI